MLGRMFNHLKRGVRVGIEATVEFIDSLKLKRSTRGYIILALGCGGVIVGLKMIKEGSVVEALELAIEVKKLESELELC